MDNDTLKIGTCSWKYNSWQGIIYPKKKPFNYLEEYSRHYKTVEVDQWFWSLFPGGTVVLPKTAVVQEYANSVPGDFRFCVKVPNSITLTHYYKKKKSDPLIPNPHFLSVDLMQEFLERVEPLSQKMGPLLFQFEYLNKQKMPGGLTQFLDQLRVFTERFEGVHAFSVETRNPNYLSDTYFTCLNEQKLHHVFLQGYYMPSIFDLYQKHREQIKQSTVIRLHGPDRKGIEVQTGKDWSRIVDPKTKDIESLVTILSDMNSRGLVSFVFVNNHFEGSAPRTIMKIKELLNKK